MVNDNQQTTNTGAKGKPAELSHGKPSQAEPAQGTVDTATRFRDRPSDDGKYGDAAAQPRPAADAEDAAGN
jgi:hypothetical protein